MDTLTELQLPSIGGELIEFATALLEENKRLRKTPPPLANQLTDEIIELKRQRDALVRMLDHSDTNDDYPEYKADFENYYRLTCERDKSTIAETVEAAAKQAALK